MNFTLLPPFATTSGSNIAKIAALGHGIWGSDEIAFSPDKASESKESDEKKYKVLGEYTDSSHDRLRIRIVFEAAPLKNFTIIGRLIQNKNSIEGRMFDAKGPREGWKIELFKGF